MFEKYDRPIFVKHGGLPSDKTNLFVKDLAYLLRLEAREVKYEIVRDKTDCRLAHLFLLSPKPEDMEEDDEEEESEVKSDRVKSTNGRGPSKVKVFRDPLLEKYLENELLPDTDSDREKRMSQVANALARYLKHVRPVVKKRELEIALSSLGDSNGALITPTDTNAYSSPTINKCIRDSRIIQSTTLAAAVELVLPGKRVWCPSSRQILYYTSNVKFQDFIRERVQIEKIGRGKRYYFADKA